MKQRDFIIALTLSFILHLLIVFAARYAPLVAGSQDASIVEIFLDKPEGGWQLADIPEPANQEKPDKSKFLGMYNQKAQEETVAGQKPEIRKEGKAGQSAGRAGQPTGEAGKTAKQEKQENAGPDTMYAPSEKKEGNEIVRGTPSRAEGGMPEDFYPDYKHGEHTYLNVLRYPEVEYFVRLKRMFKMTWNPTPVLQRELTSVSRGSVSVVMAVSVNRTGNIAELFVLKSSGLAGYDNEALRTIRASSPFSSPPNKFLKDDGMLRMSWTFIVYL